MQLVRLFITKRACHLFLVARFPRLPAAAGEGKRNRLLKASSRPQETQSPLHDGDEDLTYCRLPGWAGLAGITANQRSRVAVDITNLTGG